MKLLKNKESGQVLIMALILLAAGSCLVIPLLKQSFTNVEYHQSIECRTLNNYTADSGVEYVLCKLYGNPGIYTDPENPLHEIRTLNNRTLDVTAEYLGNGLFLVTSTASGGGCGSTTITAHINLGAGAFAYVIAAKNDIRLVGNVTIDSDDPDPETGHGDICCGDESTANGNIDLGGATVLVNGSASAVGTITGEGVVTVQPLNEGASPILFPGDYSGLYETMAKVGGTSGGLVINENRVLGPVYIAGNLTVEANTIVTLEGTVYVTGMITVNKGGRFEGQHNVVAVGDIIINGGEIGAANIPLFTSVWGSITLEGAVVHAVVYAPNGTVTVSGGVSLFGAVGGWEVIVSNATITYAQELQYREDLPGGLLYTISYSYD